MYRFVRTKSRSGTLLFSLLVFVFIFGLFYWGIDAVSATSKAEQRRSLEAALHRSIVHCYATNGTYPQSLLYLKEHYGITYDENRFYVDYQPSGENLMPEVTIIEK